MAKNEPKSIPNPPNRRRNPAPRIRQKSVVIADDENTKVVLLTFAAGAGLAEHVAPLPVIIQVIKGEAELNVGEVAVAGKA